MPLDLNEEAGDLPHNYFMGLMDEAIGESPQPAVAAPDPEPEPNAEATATTETGTFGHVTGTCSRANDVDEDDVSSQPQDPQIGMRFDTLAEAKEHYNQYALRKGFSIKQNTSRRSARTGVLEKQQFSCNKDRKQVEDDGGAEIQFKVAPIPTREELDEVDTEAAEIASVIAEIGAGGPKQKAKKKREKATLIQTACKAKMLVKLKDGRWEVTQFKAEHNHPLTWKPSLSKYLRSHQGIPADEKEFVKHLHSTNLAAGN